MTARRPLRTATADSLGRTAVGVTAVVAVHVALTLGHGVTHLTAPVPIAGWQAALAGALLYAAPLLGVGLLLRGRTRQSGWLLLAGGFGGLAVEGLLHFAVPNPDNVAVAPTGGHAFATTAVLTTAGDGLVVLAGAWLLAHSRGGPHRSAIDSKT